MGLVMQRQWVAILLIVWLGISCERAPQLAERGICAHRGSNDSHPENTIAAFKEAILLGAHMIEFDVQLSKDNELIIMHDDTVDRTTDDSGAVSDYTLAELKKLDAGSWKHPDYASERIPTLSETLEIMPLNTWLNIHLKGGPELGRLVGRTIVDANRMHQSIIACKPDVAEVVHRVDPRIKICNMDRLDNSKQYIDKTIALSAEFIQLKQRSDSSLVDLIGQLDQHGIRINYSGTNSPEKLEYLLREGIDFPLVDSVSAMISVANKIGIKPLVPIYGD